mgnify:CR=1 FL=1
MGCVVVNVLNLPSELISLRLPQPYCSGLQTIIRWHQYSQANLNTFLEQSFVEIMEHYTLQQLKLLKC